MTAQAAPLDAPAQGVLRAKESVMFSRAENLNRPSAHLGRARAYALAAGGVLALAAPALAVPPATGYQLSITTASVTFPLGTIPVGVARSATGTLSADLQNAHYTGLLGPISASSYVTSAPSGINFKMEGAVITPPHAGDAIVMAWEVIVEFTGGSASWGINGNAFAPGAGTQFVSQSGNLSPGVNPVIVTANRTFGAAGTGGNGFYSMEFNVSWNSFVAGQTLKVTVNRMDFGTSSVPSPGAVAPLAMAGVFGLSRRRRR